MSNEPQSEKKIIIDEDWKAKVEEERRAAEAAEAANAAGEGESAESYIPGDDTRLPPPDLIYLATTIYYQALASLGILPHPISKKPEVNLPLARHTIDMLEVLYTKTGGNRTAEETEAIDGMLHELRMGFLAVSSGAAQ
ncbi:MAG: DUF1844 domain-containing protein [Planctomycetota bacterium]